MQLIRLMHCSHTAQMQSAGISIRTPHRGCRSRFYGKAVQEGQRKFLGTLWNTYAFFVLYANIDGFDASKYTLEKDKLTVMDKWLLSKMNSMITEVDNNLDQYRIPEAGKALDSFVDEMSNWYVRRSRERFWAKGMEQDKISAYMTLYTALVNVCKVRSTDDPVHDRDHLSESGTQH
jgi:isoleucyl-tRNA synthetase